MSNKTSYIDEKRYFQYFENKYNDSYFRKNYPLIAQRMEQLCEKIKKKIHNNEKENFFKLHAEILGIDAQLQLILLFIDNFSFCNCLSEEQILNCVKKDYRTFMKEICDVNFIENSLCFSIY